MRFDRSNLGARRSKISIQAILAISVVTIWASAKLLFTSSQSGPPFSLYIEVVFTDEPAKEEFLREFTPLAKYVRENEPGTIAYEILLSDQNPLQVLIMERYTNKDTAYAKIHKSSKPYLEFRPKFKVMQESGAATINGHSYSDSMIGFGDRVSRG